MASYEKIDYLLRPSKQVERKLIIQALQKLSKGGYFIQDYTYLGLGSIYYADFILFHKYLSIDDMVCAEKDSIKKRMEFNKPYEFIKLFVEPVGTVIPNLNREKRHLVWLDYDFSIDADVLSDIRSTLHVLASGSIFLITVVADPVNLTNLLDSVEAKSMTDDQKKQNIALLLKDLIGAYYGQEIGISQLGFNKLPSVLAQAIHNYIDTCLTTRKGIVYYPVFNFRYRDNMQMLTIGGIIDQENANQAIQESGIFDLDYITQTDEPIQISVPPLTMREKNWLEEHLLQLRDHFSDHESNPENITFEIEAKMVKTFMKYYRHYPSYFETLL